MVNGNHSTNRLGDVVAAGNAGVSYYCNDISVWSVGLMDWTPEMTAQLRQDWADGLSTKTIGDRLGISKNAVVGKVHRLNLPSRPSPIKRDGPAPKYQRPQPAPKVTLPALPSAKVIQMPVRRLLGAVQKVATVRRLPPPVVVETPAEPAPVFTCQPPSEGCSWVEGSKHNYTYCNKTVHGRKNDDGSMKWYSYCHAHYVRSRVRHVDAADRRSDAA